MEIIRPGVNSVQQFSAVSAFKNNKTLKPVTEQIEVPEVSSGVKTSSSPSLLERIDVNDVRKCAEMVGEYNITDEDIKYGILYGRSIIAEWLC